MTFASVGISMVWTSPVIPKLRSNQTDTNPLENPITSDELSLMMILFSGGQISAHLFCGKMIDGFGRKKTLILMNMLNGIFLIILGFASDTKWMIGARIIIGICVGTSLIALPVFISEITDDHNRGKFGCLMGLFVPIGQLYTYTIGYYCSYKLFSILCAVPILISIAPLLLVPETPFHLLHRHKNDAALRSLQRYRSNLSQTGLEKDFGFLKFTMEQTIRTDEGRWKSLFCSKPNRRGFTIGLGMVLTQYGCGIVTLMSFMGPIFEDAQVGISGNMVAILVGVLKILIFFLAANVVEKLGRKTLMLVSAILCCILLFLLGTYFFLKENNMVTYRDNYSWIPILSILLFIASFSIGLGPVSQATLGELFPSNVRATAVSIINFHGIVLASILLSAFPVLSILIGISGCLWFFSFNCLIGSVFMCFLMPETKGKSFYQIHEMLKMKKNYWGRFS